MTEPEAAAAAARYGERLDGLFDQLRLRSDRPDGPARVVGWLAEQLAADVALALPPHAPQASHAPEAWAPAGADERLAAARAAADPALRTFPIGGRQPDALLALHRRAPLDALEVRLVEHVTTVLARLLADRAAAAERAALHRVSASLRVAAFQLLMGGQTTLARRTAAPLVPGVLVHDSARVYLVDCGATERDAVAELLADAAPGQALIVRCPAHDTHLIVLAPLAPDARLDERGWCATGLLLRAVVARRAELRIGGSSTVPLAHTADAYQEAFNALTVARRLPERHALYQARTELAQLLGGPARAWAEHLLRPLLELPRDQRDEVVETTRLALGFSNGQTGRILGVHRNTVTRRIERAVQLLGLEWSSFADRALLDLGLRLTSRGSPVVPRSELAGILADPAAGAWARAFLAPLAQDRRPLLRTLAGWVAAGANARDTQAALGLHHQTVLDHLRTAERLLERELTAGRTGAYELAWAVWASGAAGYPSSEM
ncbi:helix-turn-helix domain-containing protein [Kitasatospora viridis]|uniref:PucR-like helix-turn-helix protein n=1 Tax=Kitasatospora viridis TaxID=281105 RepID=A0A561UN27_9ACTN|nr:helix-turn-helix domain-containing protein [Kitasatospora viridis]TWG00771.1 PucR-like helix-turn-helix protein [Kitasatospora viridis]